MASRHIAIVGMLRAGKTTLITSLLDHWLNFHGEAMPLKGGHAILCQWKDKQLGEGQRHFEKARHQLASGKWPVKTLSPVKYELKLRLEKEYFSREIVLFDIPGERMADVDMLACGNLECWSEQMVHTFSTDASSQSHFREFHDLFYQTRDKTDYPDWLEDLEGAYRRFLANLIMHQHPLVTPSSMLMDSQGNYVPRAIRQDRDLLMTWLMTEASLGIGDNRLFPIPSALRESDFGKRMQATYKTYLDKVAKPSLSYLAACDDVIVLTDVAAILESGPAWKNTISHLYAQIAKLVDPGGAANRAIRKVGSWFVSFCSLGYYNPRRTERVIVVGSQADRIHRDDQDVLKGLVQQLARPAFKHLEFSGGVKVEVLTASAVVSSVSLNDRMLQYERIKDGELQPVETRMEPLPKEFPPEWKQHQFSFPLCVPKFPEIKSCPPPQRGLCELTELLLGL